MTRAAGVNRLPRWVVAAVTLPPAAFLAVFYAWPFATLLARGLGAGAITDTLGSARTWRVAWFTLWQAVVSTLVTLVVGLVPVGAALLLGRRRRTKRPM